MPEKETITLITTDLVPENLTILETTDLTPEENAYLDDLMTLFKDKLILDNCVEYLEDLRKVYAYAIKEGAVIEQDKEVENVPNWFKKIASRRHNNHYSKKAENFAEKITKSFTEESPFSLKIRSGMYGGKTTLAILTKSELEKKDENNVVIPCISSAMEEDYLTARALGDEKVPAERFGTEYYEKLKGKIKSIQSEGKNVTLILDEFSFLFGENLDKLEEFHRYCQNNNIATIYLGLDTGYTGLPLEAFERQDSCIDNTSEEYSCKSFLFNEDNVKRGDPTGRYTTRYVRIGGRLILDLGILPLVVSKEDVNNYTKKPIAIYMAAKKENTMLGIFKEKTIEVLKYFDRYSELQEEKLNTLKVSAV